MYQKEPIIQSKKSDNDGFTVITITGPGAEQIANRVRFMLHAANHEIVDKLRSYIPNDEMYSGDYANTLGAAVVMLDVMIGCDDDGEKA